MSLQIDGQCFDETGFSSARGAIQQNSQLVGKARNGKFSSGMHEIIHQFQQLALFWKEERVEILGIREQIALVLPRLSKDGNGRNLPSLWGDDDIS